jgi:DNA-binding XRE family transcriptional regulator
MKAISMIPFSAGQKLPAKEWAGAVEGARLRRSLQVRAEYLAEMRKKAGLTQAEVAEAMGVTQQRVSAIESGSVAELATLAH